MNQLDILLNYTRGIANYQYTINLLSWELRVTAPEKTNEDLAKLIENYKEKLFKPQTIDNLLKYGKIKEITKYLKMLI